MVCPGPLFDPEHRLTVRAVKLVRRRRARLARGGAARGLRRRARQPRSAGDAARGASSTRSRRGIAAGFQACTHAIGDGANRAVLDAYERLSTRAAGDARPAPPRSSTRRSSTQADIPRFGRLGVMASMQPTHCTSDMPWAPTRLGAARVAEGAYVWRKLMHGGASWPRDRTSPSSGPNPLLGFHAAVTRRTGRPAAGRLGSRPAADPRRGPPRYDARRRIAAHAERDAGLDRARQARRLRRAVPRYHDGRASPGALETVPDGHGAVARVIGGRKVTMPLCEP